VPRTVHPAEIVFVTKNQTDFADPGDHSKLDPGLAEEVESSDRFTLVPGLSEVVERFGQLRDDLRLGVSAAVEEARFTLAKLDSSDVRIKGDGEPHRDLALARDQLDRQLDVQVVDELVWRPKMQRKKRRKRDGVTELAREISIQEVGRLLLVSRHQLPKLRIVGSSPIARFSTSLYVAGQRGGTWSDACSGSTSSNAATNA
jgi:hypothetical protein